MDEVRTPRDIIFTLATPADVPVVVALRTAASRELTAQHGRGHWSSEPTERGIVADLRQSKVFIAWRGTEAVGTFRLSTRKPWAIDRSYFTDCERPIYLTSMAVRPQLQHKGMGRRCVSEAMRIVRAWPADALRLDAYDAEAGAGGFYAKCGFREVGRTSYRSVPLIYYELLA
jgi:GNAT superfamily N-acetyltransferase